MKQEIFDYNKFLSGKEVACFGKDNDKLLLNISRHIKPYEKPDFISLVGDTLYLIEHFEFDASLRKKNSSTLREALADDNRKIDNFFKEHPNNEMYCGSLSFKANAEIYLNNLFSSFNKHYKKIESYKDKVKKEFKFKECKIVFFIVDHTICGNFALLDTGVESVNPILSKEFEEFLVDKNDVDYLLIGVENNNNGTITCFCSRKAMLSNKIKKVSFKDKMLGCLQSMQSISTQIFIPLKKK